MPQLATPLMDKDKKRPLKGRVFQCTGFPNCSKLFTRLEHLARHRRKHTGERPFTCPHCSKNFSRLDNLRQHKQTVHAYENYIKKRLLTLPYDAPGTPLYPPTKIASPPNLGLPQYPYYPAVYRERAPDDVLREPPKFNPKNRPRPLALVRTAVDDAAIHMRTASPAVIDAPIKTAPAVPSFPHLYRSDSFSSLRLPYMSPMIVLPLLPLFHQLFNQVAQFPARKPASVVLPPIAGVREEDKRGSWLKKVLKDDAPQKAPAPPPQEKSSDSREDRGASMAINNLLSNASKEEDA